MIRVNPPPKDLCCEVCGRNVSELPLHDEKSIPPSILLELIQAHDITPDNKLTKNFRRFNGVQPNVVYPSWECVKCMSLSDDQVSEIRNMDLKINSTSIHTKVNGIPVMVFIRDDGQE